MTEGDEDEPVPLHERVPGRVVLANGAGAYDTFTVTRVS